MLTRIILIFWIMFYTNNSFSQDMIEDEEAVWALEEEYWKFVSSNNVEGFESLWDKRIIGWSSGESDPFDGLPKEAGMWINSLHNDPKRVFKYELTPELVRSFGDVVITQYRVRDYFVIVNNAERIDESSEKLTHTWQKRGNTWKIIGGMSDKLPLF